MEKMMDFEGKNSGANDPKNYNELDDSQKAVISSWIARRFMPARNVFSGRLSSTSYGLKHELETETGLYVDNGAFKGAMREAGFLPVSEEDRNWRFRMRLRPEYVATERTKSRGAKESYDA